MKSKLTVTFDDEIMSAIQKETKLQSTEEIRTYLMGAFKQELTDNCDFIEHIKFSIEVTE